MPRSMLNTSPNLLYLKKSQFIFRHNMEVECDIIDDNIKRYKRIIFPPRIYFESAILPVDKLLKEVLIEISEKNICPGYPNDNMDESCNMLVGQGKFPSNFLFFNRSKFFRLHRNFEWCCPLGVG